LDGKTRVSGTLFRNEIYIDHTNLEEDAEDALTEHSRFLEEELGGKIDVNLGGFFDALMEGFKQQPPKLAKPVRELGKFLRFMDLHDIYVKVGGDSDEFIQTYVDQAATSTLRHEEGHLLLNDFFRKRKLRLKESPKNKTLQEVYAYSHSLASGINTRTTLSELLNVRAYSDLESHKDASIEVMKLMGQIMRNYKDELFPDKPDDPDNQILRARLKQVEELEKVWETGPEIFYLALIPLLKDGAHDFLAQAGATIHKFKHSQAVGRLPKRE